jgi:hypothetical protein
MREKNATKINKLKKDGEQERLRREINSLVFDIRQNAEQIHWCCKQPEVHIGNIRESLVLIEDIFKELDAPKSTSHV